MKKLLELKVSTFVLIILLSSLLSLTLALYFFKTNRDRTIQKNKETVVRLIEEVWNRGNLQAVDQLISSRYTIRHDPGDQWEGKTLDLATFKERVKMSRDILPDQKFYIQDLVCEDDKVAVSWKFSGTQQEKFLV